MNLIREFWLVGYLAEYLISDIQLKYTKVLRLATPVHRLSYLDYSMRPATFFLVWYFSRKLCSELVFSSVDPLCFDLMKTRLSFVSLWCKGDSTVFFYYICLIFVSRGLRELTIAVLNCWRTHRIGMRWILHR